MIASQLSAHWIDRVFEQIPQVPGPRCAGRAVRADDADMVGLAAAALPKPVTVWREPRIEDGGERLRDGLLDQPIQCRGHSQLAFPTVGLGDGHLPHGTRTVAPRIEGSTDFRPVGFQPGSQLGDRPPVHARGTLMDLDALQCPQQIGAGRLPQSLLAGRSSGSSG